MKKWLKLVIPGPWRRRLRRAFYFPLDLLSTVFQGRSVKTSLCPPRGMRFVGDGDFQRVGERNVEHLVQLCQLKPHETVLDIGCGIGRVAIPLTQLLSSSGRYDGIDIVPEGIQWCQKQITTRYPHFRFQVADIYNGTYNPNGRYRADDYRFPYESESYDLIFLYSVFTHLLPHDLEHYLSQVGRLLKPNGRCLITYFLCNPTSLAGMTPSSLNLKYNHGSYFTANKHEPEEAVGYCEEWILNLYEKYGLNVTQSIYYGSWSNRPVFLDYQDIVIASKATSDRCCTPMRSVSLGSPHTFKHS